MDGDTIGIDGSNSRGGDDHSTFGTFLNNGFQEGGLSCSRFSCEKDAMPRMFYEVPRLSELFVMLHVAR